MRTRWPTSGGRSCTAYVDGWRRRRRVRMDPTDTPPETPVPGGLDGLDGAEHRVDLKRLLEELTDRERAMVVLRYYLDCSVAGGRGRARLLASAPSRAPARAPCSASGSPLRPSKGSPHDRPRPASRIRGSTGAVGRTTSPTCRRSWPADVAGAGVRAPSGPPPVSRPPSSPSRPAAAASGPSGRRPRPRRGDHRGDPAAITAVRPFDGHGPGTTANASPSRCGCVDGGARRPEAGGPTIGAPPGPRFTRETPDRRR